MRERRPALWATLLITVTLFFAVLVGIIYEDFRAASEYEKNYQMMQDELVSSGLVSEQIALEREIKLLSDKESKRIPTITFLCRTPHRLVYDSIKPVMATFGMTGTICLSNASLPGDSLNMTVKQYQSMLTAGFSSAVLYDGSAALDAYLTELRGKTAELGISFPKTLYVYGEVEEKPYYMFEYDRKGKPIFTEEIKTVLDAHGIEHVIQETYERKIVSYQNFYEPLTYCEALGFNSSGKLSKNSFLETLKSRGALVFSVQFELDRKNYGYGAHYGDYSSENSGSDETTSDDFLRMLDTVYDYGDGIKITDVPSVSDYREKFNSELQLDSETDKRLAQLELRLLEVKREIAAIRAKYGE